MAISGKAIGIGVLAALITVAILSRFSVPFVLPNGGKLMVTPPG